jgi:cytochrome c556
MQANSIKKLAYLGVILILTTLSLSSCTDNARAQECKNIKKLIATNSSEIVEISKEQKPYSAYDIKRAELQLQKAGIYENNRKLEQDYQIKCTK